MCVCMARGSNITPPLPPQHSSLWPGLPFFASFAPIDMPPCSRFLLPAAQLTGRSYEATFALSVVPAVLGLAVVATALGGDARSPGHHAAHLASMDEGGPLGLRERAAALLHALPSGYWQALAATAVLYLARFDTAFITVHASSVRLPSCIFPHVHRQSFNFGFLLGAACRYWPPESAAAQSRSLAVPALCAPPAGNGHWQAPHADPVLHAPCCTAGAYCRLASGAAGIACLAAA
jgi:hypothetical protein